MNLVVSHFLTADIYDPKLGMANSKDAFVFVDNHANQRRHKGSGNVVTYKVIT